MVLDNFFWYIFQSFIAAVCVITSVAEHYVWTGACVTVLIKKRF